MEDPVTGIPLLIQNIGTVLTNVLTWLTDILEWAVDEPLVLFFMAIGLAGAMFRWARKLVHF